MIGQTLSLRSVETSTARHPEDFTLSTDYFKKL